MTLLKGIHDESISESLSPEGARLARNRSAFKARIALGLLEILYFGNEDGVTDKHDKRGRRYSAEEKAAAVRMVRTLRAELGTNQGTVQRVATQRGYGPESVRPWVTQADIDAGKREGVPSDSAAEIRMLEQGNRALKRAKEILRWVTSQGVV